MDTAGKGGIVRARRRRGRPAGRAPRVVQEADRRGEGARLPLAHPRAAAAAGADRRVRPLALRGRADRTGCASSRRPRMIEQRYGAIIEFERELVADGTTIIKVMLHISFEEQRPAACRPGSSAREALEVQPERHRRARAVARLPGGVPARHRAHLDRASRPGTSSPRDHKWYARLAVQHLLLDALAGLDQQWPVADFDVEAERARLRGVAPRWRSPGLIFGAMAIAAGCLLIIFRGTPGEARLAPAGTSSSSASETDCGRSADPLDDVDAPSAGCVGE